MENALIRYLIYIYIYVYMQPLMCLIMGQCPRAGLLPRPMRQASAPRERQGDGWTSRASPSIDPGMKGVSQNANPSKEHVS